MNKEARDEITPHEAWEELAALAALEGLPESEQVQLMAHLDECAQCRRSFDAYRQVADQLALGIPRVEAPPHLKERLSEAIRDEPAPTGRRTIRAWSQPAWWVAAAAILVGIVLGLQNRALRQDLEMVRQQQAVVSAALVSPRAQPILLEPLGEQGAGRFVWAPGNPLGSLLVEELPPNRTYRLWLIKKDGTAEDGGLFYVGPDGKAQLVVDAPSPWSTYGALGVSEEPGGEDVQEGGDYILGGDF